MSGMTLEMLTKADEFAARRAAAQDKRAQEPKTWEESEISDLGATSSVSYYFHRAWITDGKNKMGIRDSEDDPIYRPSPSPMAWTDSPRTRY